MKTLIKTVFFLFFVLGVSSAQQLMIKKATIEGKEVQVENNVIHFGQIPHKNHAAAAVEITVQNTDGLNALVISQCQTSCGCTTPTCPKQPIRPNQEEKITIQYEADRLGAFEKQVVFYTNSTEKSLTTLTIKGEVVAKK